jgi:hypothetical protein
MPFTHFINAKQWEDVDLMHVALDRASDVLL